MHCKTFAVYGLPFQSVRFWMPKSTRETGPSNPDKK